MNRPYGVKIKALGPRHSLPSSALVEGGEDDANSQNNQMST